MKNLIQAAVLTLLAASTAQAQQAAQWKVSDGGNGHWFALGAPAASWHASAADAALKGGHLATLLSAGETAFAAAVTGGENVAYIGALQAPGSAEPFGGWRWITGEPWGYEAWHFNMDDAPCGSSAGDGEQQFLWMHNAVRQWEDVNEQDFPDCPLESKRGIVEWSADCNGDGVVDYGQCRDGSLPDYNGNNVPDCCETGQPCVVGNYPVQWKVSDGGNGHWYALEVPIEPITWRQAQERCESRGGYLATLPTMAENSRVLGIVGQRPAYLGGFQADGSCEPGCGWRWLSGETWGFANWNPVEPNNAAGAQNYLRTYSDGLWDDIGGDVAYPFAIATEWSTDCNNDGIVDKGQILLGQIADTNNNGVPDACEPPSLDCNSNSIRDDREIASGRALDYNANQIPDECDSAMGLPRIRSMVLNRGPGNGPGYCGTWDTRDNPRYLWNLWVSRTGEDGPWVNAQDPSAGLPLALEMQLLPGDNILTIRHDFNGCDGQTQNVHLWLNDLDLPSVSGLGGIVPSPFSGLVVGPSGGNQVAAAGTLHARVGAWNVRLESFTWSLGSDRVGNFVPQPNGVADNVSTVRIRVYKDCPCDVFRDFSVNGADLGILLSQWGITNQYTVTDFNDDGSVDGIDLGMLLAAWGPCPN